MRVLLDACVPERLAGYLVGHAVSTVRSTFGTADVDDGPLLDALAGRFDAFVTVDKNLRFQQRLRSRPFRIILLRAHSNAIDTLVPLVPEVLHALSEMGSGDLRVVGL